METEGVPGALGRVLDDIAEERAAQDRRWGVQEFPDGSGPQYAEAAERAKRECAEAWTRGELTWRHVLTEEFYEALAESDPAELRTELIQTAAVAVKWVQDLDRRHGAASRPGGSGGARAEKLVRDRVPDIIRADGREPDVRVVAEPEYAAMLRAKLYEEAGEYVSSGDAEELADLLEVVHALAALHGLDPEELERRRAAKAAERGGFAGRTVLRLPSGSSQS
ncbi:nucleoside triphosphate pyrophosphohydrolase [Actinomadura sp. NPDC047616]|uniref:nucleoside triphosphate pyrophosphohydrolase n=1 Tax=Actinomadura sp. NPDC047616 TaxID=3155914 RepID=UPI0033EB6AB2